MCLRFVLILLFFVIGNVSAFSFEIERSGDDYNIVFVKNKRPVNENKTKKTTSSKNNKSINNAIVRTKVNGEIINSNVNSNNKMYASATGNLNLKDANDLLKNLVGTTDSNKKTSVVKKNNIKTKPKTKASGQSKVVVSYSGDSVVVDNELCKMVARNDVVNVKKTLSMMKYGSKYVNWRCEHNTPLFLLAVENNNLLVAKLLIEKGANVNLVDNAGVSALHWVARSMNEATMDIFALIINVDDVDVNIRDIEGYTPLMRAVEFENVNIVHALLERQSDVYIKNNYGESAIKLTRKRLEAKKDNDDKTNIEKILGFLEVKI